jgi:L,D-peptidoglycan transpeptidase YkuD (ErfK/YbiS/YcfS/YnhG family)
MDIVVRRREDGFAADWGAGARPCAAGRGGIAEKQREGDGITPVGIWPLRNVLYRPDRVAPPKTSLPVSPLAPADGWCETPGDPDYNKPVRLPHRAAAESMWRDDALYDVVVVVGYNDDPVVAGKGSAIFVHVARPDYGPTEGCVAMTREDILEAVAQFAPGDRLIVTD